MISIWVELPQSPVSRLLGSDHQHLTAGLQVSQYTECHRQCTMYQTLDNSHKIQVSNTNTENQRKCQRKCILLPAFQENTKCAWKRKIWGSVRLPSNVSESRVSRKLAVSRNLGNNSRALCGVLCCVLCGTVHCATVRADMVVVLKKKAQLVLYFYISYTVEPWSISCFKKILWGSVRPFALLACFFPDRI